MRMREEISTPAAAKFIRLAPEGVSSECME